MPTSFTHVDSGNTDTTESFFSDLFLRSRIRSGKESNAGYDPLLGENRDENWLESHWKEVKNNDLKYDEDVNQYITLLLSEMANPQTLGFSNKYTVGINSDVGQLAVNEPQKSKKFVLYRVNADFLLLYLGLLSRLGSAMGNAYFDKGESYYYFAASSLKQSVGGRNGLSDVFEKLSQGFGKYVGLLREMKSESDNYLSFHYQISPSEMSELEKTLTTESKKKNEPGESPEAI